MDIVELPDLDRLVFPGHPLVIATFIVRTFPSILDADERTEFGWCQAQSDERIPGAGDQVAVAMQCLRLGRGGASVDEIVAHARNAWLRGEAGGHRDQVAAGVAQADAVEAAFRSSISPAWWGSPTG